MGVIFFEDFSQDEISSIAGRYPKTARSVLGTDIGGWPLSKTTTTSAFAALPVNSSKRTEVYLDLDDNGYATRTAVVTCFYGIILYAPNTTQISLYTATAAGAAATAPMYVSGYGVTPRNLRKVYIDVNFGLRTITLMLNGQMILNRLVMPADWQSWYMPSASNAAYCYSTNGCPYLANTIRKIVIATDNPQGSMLDVNALQVTKRDLNFVSQTDLTYSSVGFVEDVDKVTPLTTTPNISTTTFGAVSYSSVKPTDSIAAKGYIGGYSENPRRFVTAQGSLREMPRFAGAMQQFNLNADALSVEIVSQPYFTAEITVTTANQVLSPRFDTGTNISVDWGDGSLSNAASTGRLDHTYTTPGVYTLKIAGKCNRLVLASPLLTRVTAWGDMGFNGFQFYKSTATSDPELTSPNLVEVPTALPPGITDLSYTFYRCTAFNQPILNNGWDLSGVTTLYAFLGVVSAELSEYNQPIDIKTPATDLQYFLYARAKFNSPIKIELLNGPISVNMSNAFAQMTIMNSMVTLIGGRRVTGGVSMFQNCTAFNQDLSGWCVSNMLAKPTNFDAGCTAWTNQAWRPVWGTCPLGV